jgi:predicted CoA-binding protein
MSLAECEQPIDVVDLVISPSIGPSIIDEMAVLGIRNVFIQPGAASEEILKKCSELEISVHQGCVLVEL